MYSQFQASYQRLDASLQKLTDSIAAYNPSTTAAEELVAADEAVDRDIDQLIKHQQNHARLEHLRRTANALDEKIKDTIRLLADTRKEIQDIPSSETTGLRREVNVDDLLSYAKFIAKSTVPPTIRTPLQPVAPANNKPENGDAQPTTTTTGTGTPPAAGNSQEGIENKEANATKEVYETGEKLTNPETLLFDPWPSGQMMQKGVLSRIQIMLENGIDPATVLTPEEQAEVDRQRDERLERERREEQEKLRRAAQQAYEQQRRRPTVDTSKPFNPDDL